MPWWGYETAAAAARLPLAPSEVLYSMRLSTISSAVGLHRTTM
jgi:hypothetical protein